MCGTIRTSPAADKVGYTAAVTMKHTFGNVLNTAIVTTSAGVGGLFLDGVGMVLGAALGSVAAGYISDLIDQDLELYKQLFAQLRFQSIGRQCTNRGLVSSTFKMPAYTSSGGSDALSRRAGSAQHIRLQPDIQREAIFFLLCRRDVRR